MIVTAAARATSRRGGLPPGPRLPALAQSLAYAVRPMEYLHRCRHRFGERFTLRFHGGHTFVLVADPEDVKAIFVGDPDVFLAGRAKQAQFGPYLGEASLLVIDGEPHRRHRKLLMPPLRGESLRANTAVIRDVALERLERWPIGRPFRALEEMREIALQVIFRVLFGVSDRSRAVRLAELVSRLTSYATWMISLRLPKVDLSRMSPYGRFRRVRAEFDAMLAEEIAEVRGGRERDDILARLVAENAAQPAPLSDQELVDELLTLLVAGHETTVSTLAWALHWILGDGAVSQRVFEEVRAAGADVEPERLGALPFLDAAIHETLRMTPPLVLAPRWLARDAAVGDLELPAGTWVSPSPFLTHYDPAIYPRPRHFDPTRFVGRRFGPFEFLPFGGGSRLCVGATFAVVEVRVVLATLLSRADLRRADAAPQRLSRHGMSLVPSRGTPVVLERRL